MEVVVKSFNRAYLLDHVLRSVRQGDEDEEHSVIVADDGTPDIYLEEICRRHNNIRIFRSGREIDPENPANVPFSSQVHRAIRNWKAAVAAVQGESFLLLEDDTWFCSPVDLDGLGEVARSLGVVYLSLTEGNEHFESLPVVSRDRYGNGIAIGRPSFLDNSSKLFRFLQISQLGAPGLRFSVWRLARRTPLHPSTQWLRNYQAYGVTSAVFDKGWWLHLWESHQDEIQEGVQMERALRALWRQKSSSVGSMTRPVIRTTIRSSSQEVHQHGRPYFRVSLMNKCLNDAWLNEGWNVDLRSGELDIQDVLLQFSRANMPKSLGPEWVTWFNHVARDRALLGFA